MAGAYEGVPTMGQKLDYILTNVFSGEGNEEYEYIFRVIQVYTSDPDVKYLELDAEQARPYFEEMYAFVYKLIDYFLFYRYNQYDGPFTRSARRRAAESLFDAYVQKQSDLEHALLHQFDEFLSEVIENRRLVFEINQIKVGNGSTIKSHSDLGQVTFNTTRSGLNAVREVFSSNRGIIIATLIAHTGFSPLTCSIMVFGAMLLGPSVVQMASTPIYNRFSSAKTESIISTLNRYDIAAANTEDMELLNTVIDEKYDDLKRKILTKQKLERSLDSSWSKWFMGVNANDRLLISNYRSRRSIIESLRKDAYALFEIMFGSPANKNPTEGEKLKANFLIRGAKYTDLDYETRKRLIGALFVYFSELPPEQSDTTDSDTTDSDTTESTTPSKRGTPITDEIQQKFITLFPDRLHQPGI